MNRSITVPCSLRDAAYVLRTSFASRTERLPKSRLIRAWWAIAYLYPALHPDGYELPDSAWPRALRRFAEEVWKRAERGRVTDEELYPSDAQWAGIYDRMLIHDGDEDERRLQIAAAYGRGVNG